MENAESSQLAKLKADEMLSENGDEDRDRWREDDGC
jgi:hypothetical protein